MGDAVPGLKAFIGEYISEHAMGSGGYLVSRGLVALDPGRLHQIQNAVGNEAIILSRSD